MLGMKSRTASRIIPPQPGRPHWVAPSRNSGLIYLSWGSRSFSSAPIPEHRNPGWSYVFVRSGIVRMTHSRGEVVLKESQGLVAGPECSFGFRHGDAEACELLVWIFRSASTHGSLTLGDSEYRVFRVAAQPFQAIERLHAHSRDEVSQDDAYSEQAIDSIRSLLDVCLARRQPVTPQQEQDHRLRLARAWMQNNLELNDPVRSLCQYLQVSSSTLRRLFQERYGVTPGAMHRGMRLREARRLISDEGWMVKQAAYRLGYRHANDLSRALSRHAEQKSPKGQGG